LGLPDEAVVLVVAEHHYRRRGSLVRLARAFRK